MKKLLLALALLAVGQPAFASKHIAYKLYHYGVHYPVQAITFVFNAPVIIVRWADRSFDEALEYDDED